MSVLLGLIIIVTIAGVMMLGSMFVRGDSRLGMAGLAVLIVGESMAMVYAMLQA
jgi:hypothetical protein